MLLWTLAKRNIPSAVTGLSNFFRKKSFTEIMRKAHLVEDLKRGKFGLPFILPLFLRSQEDGDRSDSFGCYVINTKGVYLATYTDKRDFCFSHSLEMLIKLQGITKAIIEDNGLCVYEIPNISKSYSPTIFTTSIQDPFFSESFTRLLSIYKKIYESTKIKTEYPERRSIVEKIKLLNQIMPDIASKLTKEYNKIRKNPLTGINSKRFPFCSLENMSYNSFISTIEKRVMCFIMDDLFLYPVEQIVGSLCTLFLMPAKVARDLASNVLVTDVEPLDYSSYYQYSPKESKPFFGLKTQEEEEEDDDKVEALEDDMERESLIPAKRGKAQTLALDKAEVEKQKRGKGVGLEEIDEDKGGAEDIFKLPDVKTTAGSEKKDEKEEEGFESNLRSKRFLLAQKASSGAGECAASEKVVKTFMKLFLIEKIILMSEDFYENGFPKSKKLSEEQKENLMLGVKTIKTAEMFKSFLKANFTNTAWENLLYSGELDYDICIEILLKYMQLFL